VIFNVLLAAGAAVIFFRAISNRLTVLHDNSFRLARNQQLHPPVEGEDEIADVDRAFHSMASALTEALHKQKSLIENARDVICSLDEGLTFLAVSQAAFDVFGYQPDDLVGGNLMNLIPDADASAVRNNFKAGREGQSEHPFEIRIIHKSGALVDVLLSAHWSPDEGTLFCVAHDITERKGAERLRKEIVQMVTHDLRTPLTTVQHFHTMLAEGLFGGLDQRGLKTLEAADHSTTRMLRLINDLLDIEKMEAGSLELNQSLVQLSEALEQSLQQVLPLASAKGVRVESQPTNLTIYCDSERLIQVMVNLLTNAIKFTPPGAKVVMSAQPTSDGVEVKVADEGRGIPASMIETIFDRFKQVQVSDARGRSGFGLGLAICKALVELHGGTISVDSQEGMGATFSLRLPMKEPLEKSAVRVKAELQNL
jgi:PAS domain S-box-containing protein